jgi:hypothetical protein
MEKQNQKVEGTSQATMQAILSGMTKNKHKKTGEVRNLISEVVKFSVKMCSEIRQFSSFSL